jgi:hypothetical protein
VAALFYYLGRTLQVSGLLLGLLVIIMFFNPLNGEARLLMLTVVSAVVFTVGHLLISSTGSRE